MDPSPWPAALSHISGSDDKSVMALMRRVCTSIARAADDRLEPHGVTRAQMGPLYMLRAARASSIAEIARELHIDPGATTRMLDRLEGKGLCRRLRSRDDCRVVRIELTPEGHLAADRLVIELADVMNAHLAGFSIAEWIHLRHLLRQMLNNADSAPANEAPPSAVTDAYASGSHCE